MHKFHKPSRTNWSGRGVKPKFSVAEDNKLRELVSRMGIKSWDTIAHRMKNKTSKQCRDRWYNYVNPDLCLAEWNDEDDIALVEKFNQIGPKWTILSRHFNGRSVNNIRNRWLKLKRSKKYEFTYQKNSEQGSSDDQSFDANALTKAEPANEHRVVISRDEQIIQPPDIFKDLEKEINSFDIFHESTQNCDHTGNPICYIF